MASKKGQTMCIFSSKGGVGKTTTLVNLAGIYKTLNKKVLLIDLDLYGGGIALALNKKVDTTIFNLVDDFANNRYKDFKDYVTSYNDYIDVLSAPKDPRQANLIDSRYINAIIDRASYLYDMVLIDTNTVLDENNLTVLDKVDRILFVMNNDPFDVKNMKSLLSIFNELEITKYKILLNDSRDPFKDYFSLYDIRSMVKKNVDFTIPKNMFLRNIDYYLMDGNLLFENKSVPQSYKKEKNKFIEIAKSLIKEGDEK